jgi:hypothetical protein
LKKLAKTQFWEPEKLAKTEPWEAGARERFLAGNAERPNVSNHSLGVSSHGEPPYVFKNNKKIFNNITVLPGGQ